MQDAHRSLETAAMAARPTRSAGGRSGQGFRTRLLLSFLLPLLLLGTVGFLLLDSAAGKHPQLDSKQTILLGFGAAFAVSVLLAVGLAVNIGDRVTRPVLRLLRLMDAGQLRVLMSAPRFPRSDIREIGALTERVRALVQQNLSGAEAMRDLEALSEEVSRILEAAGSGRLADPDYEGPHVTQALTRRLLAYLRERETALAGACEGLERLKNLLLADWRDQRERIEGISQRLQAQFVQANEAAVHASSVIKELGGAREAVARLEEAASVLRDMELSFEHWRKESDAFLEDAKRLVEEGEDYRDDAEAVVARLERLKEWGAWVQASLELLETSLRPGDDGLVSLEKVGTLARQVESSTSETAQVLGTLARDALDLKEGWVRLGDRLEAMMARTEEIAALQPGRSTTEGENRVEAKESEEEGSRAGGEASEVVW